jgi:hypothetical protein
MEHTALTVAVIAFDIAKVKTSVEKFDAIMEALQDSPLARMMPGMGG